MYQPQQPQLSSPPNSRSPSSEYPDRYQSKLRSIPDYKIASSPVFAFSPTAPPSTTGSSLSTNVSLPPSIDVANIHALDDTDLTDFESAYDALTQIQAQYVELQLEQLRQMQQQNLMLQKSRSSGQLLREMSAHNTSSLFGKDNHLEYHGQLANLTENSNSATNSINRSTNNRANSNRNLINSNHQHSNASRQEILSENETNALQGFLDDFLVDTDDQNELDRLINSLGYPEDFSSNEVEEVSTATSSILPSTSKNSDHIYVSSATPIDSSYTPHLGSNSPKQPPSDRNSKPDCSSSATPLVQSLKPSPVIKSAPPPKRRPRKRLLSEQEKRFNHTSSEKKRRLLIKTAFDDLVARLPLEDLQKQHEQNSNHRKGHGKAGGAKMSKFVVLDITGNEIEKLSNLNKKLKELCVVNGIEILSCNDGMTV
ncbi:hypothetical protein DASC09_043720 [Saccharomycopsis crataegensis]|uniref:BHLH domain-containing protein n=1 Tax=Saccharomycopsis crataegensis TaxID=43959 RepID=A0AAV5QQA5_9ASCO|nr:hypothetical protein DASC09_043720 [Saccharomycopsis crataegensis]